MMTDVELAHAVGKLQSELAEHVTNLGEYVAVIPATRILADRGDGLVEEVDPHGGTILGFPVIVNPHAPPGRIWLVHESVLEAMP